MQYPPLEGELKGEELYSLFGNRLRNPGRVTVTVFVNILKWLDICRSMDLFPGEERL